jgi:CRISPR type IV-associated protein Csf2
MKKAQKYIIAIDISTLSPMHITAIEKGTYDVDNQRVNRYKAATGIGCSLTRTMAMAHHAQVSNTGSVYAPLVPVIPSSTVSGNLRRAATDLICDSLINRSLTLSPAAYNVLSSGMATTELKGSEKTAAVVTMARKDAFFSLFGGTSFALDSHCVIGEGLPIIDMTEGLMMSPAIADKRPFSSLSEMTDVFAIIKKDDVMDMRRETLEPTVGFESVSQYQIDKAAESAQKKSKKVEEEAGAEGGKKTDLRTFNAFEVVKTGINFGIRMEVTSFAPSHLGLMLMAAQSFLRKGQVGGKEAKGFGRFTLSASRLYKVDPVTRLHTSYAEIFENQQAGYQFKAIEAADDVMNEAVLAAEDYLDCVQPSLIEAFAAADADALKKALMADLEGVAA